MSSFNMRKNHHRVEREIIAEYTEEINGVPVLIKRYAPSHNSLFDTLEDHLEQIVETISYEEYLTTSDPDTEQL